LGKKVEMLTKGKWKRVIGEKGRAYDAYEEERASIRVPRVVMAGEDDGHVPHAPHRACEKTTFPEAKAELTKPKQENRSQKKRKEVGEGQVDERMKEIDLGRR